MPKKHTPRTSRLRNPSIVVEVQNADQKVLDDLEQLSDTPEELLTHDEDESQNCHTFEDFLSTLKDDDKDPEKIIESSNLSRSFMETMRLDSEIHGNLSSFRSGGAAPLRTDPTKTAKSLKIKSKSYSSPTDKLPLLGGVIPAHKIFNRLAPDRTPDTKALLDKDANGEKVQLTKTPIELLRLITKGDVEIEQIDNTTIPPKLILKYKENEGSIEFKGRFVLLLNSNGKDRKQEYDPDYGDKLDPLKKLDQENKTDISKMITANSPLMKDHSNELQLVTEFFTKYPDTEMSIFYTTEEPYIATQEILKLEVLASNGKAITTDVDIATRSIPLNLSLPTNLDRHLYEPINMSETGVVKKIQNKRKLLKYTMELFEHFKQNYYQKMTKLEQEIIKTQKQAEETVSPEESPKLQEKLKTLKLQHKMLSESPIGKFMVQEQAQASQTKNGSTLSKIRQIFSKTQQPKLNFSDLFLDGEDAKKHFTELAGIVTPFEFLQNILNNYIAKTDALQHGTDIRNPAKPEDAEQTMFFNGKIFRTKNDAQRMKLYLADEFFEQQFIPVNPKSNMKIWGKLVEKQLASEKHKARVSEKTKLAYFDHLMKNPYYYKQKADLATLIKDLIHDDQFLDLQQKKEFLEYVKQHTGPSGDENIYIHGIINKAQLMLSSYEPQQPPKKSFKERLKQVKIHWLNGNQQPFSPKHGSLSELPSPKRSLEEAKQTYSPTNSPTNNPTTITNRRRKSS